MGYCCIKQNIITWSHRDSNAESGEAEEGDNSVMDATFIDTLQINLSYAHGEILVGMTACEYIPTKRHCTKIFGACYGWGEVMVLKGTCSLAFINWWITHVSAKDSKAASARVVIFIKTLQCCLERDE